MSELELAGLELQNLLWVDLNVINTTYRHLLEIREWAIDSLGLDYTTGDRVELAAPADCGRPGSGWYPYREALRIGCQGTAGEISFSSASRRWSCLVGLERTWSVHDWGNGAPLRRFWNGPPEECPEGFELAMRPKVKHFYLPVHDLRKVK